MSVFSRRSDVHCDRLVAISDIFRPSASNDSWIDLCSERLGPSNYGRCRSDVWLETQHGHHWRGLHRQYHYFYLRKQQLRNNNAWQTTGHSGQTERYVRAGSFVESFFLSRSTMSERDKAIVCPSVRPSHAGIDSKLMSVVQRGFHHWAARQL